MLKIKKAYECSVEFDPYVTLKIVFGQQGYIEKTVYWRTGDQERLIEVGVGAEQGELRSITLVLIKKIKIGLRSLPQYYSAPGIPVFSRLDYDKNLFFDEVGPLEMFVGGDKLQVFFSNNLIVSGFICDRATCLFDGDGQFCGFEVTNIIAKEKKILEEYCINRK